MGRPLGLQHGAPDCVDKNGKYYYYFPAVAKDTVPGKKFAISVALSNRPTGPFTPQQNAIKGVRGIDPNVFMDHDGQAYLYWSEGNIYAAKLTQNMLAITTEPLIIENLPKTGLKEGPFMFERNGIYYLTYPHVENKIERLEYAMSRNPLGPFRFAGVIMDESPTGCWTNHHSIVKFKGQHYLFYHGNDLSPQFDKNRSVRIDSLFFEKDGKIRKVVPTIRGVGFTRATDKIQIDRYSEIGGKISISFVDSAKTSLGWKARLSGQGSWIRYNAVGFSGAKYRQATVRACASKDSRIEIRLDRPDGILIGGCKIKKSDNWLSVLVSSRLVPEGRHDLFFVLKEDAPVEVDWVQFK